MTMTRREFGIRTAAALIASRLALRESTVPDLTPFCDSPGSPSPRFEMTQPFEQQSLVYATDGRAAVRTDLVSARSLGEQVRLPPIAEKPFWQHDCVGLWRPWKGVRVRYRGIGCPSCRGEGDWCCDFGCEKCKGTGHVILCGECNGTGEVDYAYRVAGRLVAPYYYQQIAALGDVQVSTERAAVEEPLMFRGGGVDGVVMPMWERSDYR